jgi:hypothetical protein
MAQAVSPTLADRSIPGEATPYLLLLRQIRSPEGVLVAAVLLRWRPPSSTTCRRTSVGCPDDRQPGRQQGNRTQCW